MEPTSEQLSEFGRWMRAQRKTPPPQNLQPCKHCGELLGTNARRKHLPLCPKNPKNLAAKKLSQHPKKPRPDPVLSPTVPGPAFRIKKLGFRPPNR